MPRKKQQSMPIRSDLLRYSGGFDSMIEAVELDLAMRRRWAREYCRAVGIILQIPGGALYEYDRRVGSRFSRWIWNTDPGPAAAILAQSLEQLGVPSVLDELWRARRLAEFPLPRDVRYRLRNGADTRTLVTAIDCLDRLLVAPVLPTYARHRDGCVRKPLAPRPFPRFA